MFRTDRTRSHALSGPQADLAFAPLAAPEIHRRVRLAHLSYQTRTLSRRYIGGPLGDQLFKVWLRGGLGASLVEKFGLPRPNLIAYLGEASLTLDVNPRELFQFAMHLPRHQGKRPSSLAFIWDGDWDLRRDDLRMGYWLNLVRDLDENRHHLERTAKFKELFQKIKDGDPWHSHQQGVYLDTPEKIFSYLNVYVGFLDNMIEHGYDRQRPKDALGVVISREGRILKINRGLHRLAMAQWIGLPTIPVQVRHIHRLWWQDVTRGANGEIALERMRDALPRLSPEQAHGPLSDAAPFLLPDEFWPPAKTATENG